MGEAMATCTVRITDHPVGCGGIAVSLVDEDENVVLTVDGRQLDDDPRGVMAEVFQHLNLCAQSYSLRAVAAA